MLAGAPRPLASAALARLRIGMEVQVMTFPVEPYRGSGGYCLRVGPPPHDGLRGWRCWWGRRLEAGSCISLWIYHCLCLTTRLTALSLRVSWSTKPHWPQERSNWHITALWKGFSLLKPLRSPTLTRQVSLSLTHTLEPTHLPHRSCHFRHKKPWQRSTCPLARAK